MPSELEIASLLEALTRGISDGMEKRRKASLDEKKLAIEEQEMKEKHEDRRLAREQNDLYRTLLLKQTGERDAATIEAKKADTEVKKASVQQKDKELALKEKEVSRKFEEDSNERMLRAGDQLRKYGEDEAKWQKKLGNAELMLKENPQDQEAVQAYKTAKTNLDTIRKGKRSAKILSVGAKKDIIPFMGQLDNINDPKEAKTLLDKLVKSGRFEANSKEMQLLVDEYLDKFGAE